MTQQNNIPDVTASASPAAAIPPTLAFGPRDIAILLIVAVATIIFFVVRSGGNSKWSPPTSSTLKSPTATSATSPTAKPPPPKKQKKSIIAKLTSTSTEDLGTPRHLFVFYGSQTGTAEDLANRFAKELKAMFSLSVTVCDLEEYDFSEILMLPASVVGSVLVGFFLATYGEGEPTDNAAEFYEWLLKGRGKGDDLADDVEDDDEEEREGAKNLNYFMFGLGNKTYEHFNAIAKRADKRFKALGSVRQGPLGSGDDDGSMEDDFLNWKPKAIEAITEYFNFDASSTQAKPSRDASHVAQFKLTEVGDAPVTAIFGGELSSGKPRSWTKEDSYVEKKATSFAYDAKNPFYAPIVKSSYLYNATYDNFKFPDVPTAGLPASDTERKVAVTLDSRSIQIERQCMHLEFSLEGSGLKYETGDHVGVYAANDTRDVLALAAALRIPEDRLDTLIDLSPVNTNEEVSRPFPTPCTIRAALTYYLDLRTPMKQYQLEILARFATNEGDREKLFDFAEKRELFVQAVESQQLTLCEVLQLFPSIQIPVAVVLGEILTRPGVRYYSISSSSAKQPKIVSATAVIVRYAIAQPTLSNRIVIKEGLATSFLQRLHELRIRYAVEHASAKSAVLATHVPVSLRTSSFRLPRNVSLPVVMVGPGTGVAPFRAFLWERVEALERSGAEVGPTWLFFGCRHPDQDFMYKDEFEEIKRRAGDDDDKVKIVTAFSRVPGQPKVYVQQTMAEHMDAIWRMLETQKGHFYVCGDAKSMAKDVNAMLVKIAQKVGGQSEEEATRWVKNLKTTGRYQEDTWS
ncbi:hypothetical protein BJ742DRAFT_805387 [Cladochytrium replicatum]|nr:hypothetical protein BJ742DRAFT_805387 [Cladochytrium replicatum]